MAEPHNVPFDLMGWVEANRDQFRPPVGNNVLWRDSDFIAFVSGANARNDFHVNPGDEIFFQLAGEARVDLQVEGKRVTNPLRAGEVLLVPAGTPHAPRRPAGTWGFVVERVRRPGELDGFQWYCEGCNQLLHEVKFQLHDITGQFGDILTEFNRDVRKRTCPACGQVLPLPGGVDVSAVR
jgi:3-hydroxyanthranilate 3,4-dioxygenase